MGLTSPRLRPPVACGEATGEVLVGQALAGSLWPLLPLPVRPQVNEYLFTVPPPRLSPPHFSTQTQSQKGPSGYPVSLKVTVSTTHRGRV